MPRKPSDPQAIAALATASCVALGEDHDLSVALMEAIDGTEAEREKARDMAEYLNAADARKRWGVFMAAVG